MMIAGPEWEQLAKERSTLLTKTVFRLIACAYLSYEGYFRLIRGHLTDPETYPRGAFFFGILFLVMAVLYLIHGARVYLRESRRLRERQRELEKADNQ